MTDGSESRVFLNEYYTENKSERQMYDLVLPKDAKDRLGLVLCIHGGGWFEGSKDAYTKTLSQLCEEKGVAAACINYRYVSDTVCFGDLLEDISSALSAIKEKGTAYGVAFDKVLLTGISAGGHLSLLYAYMHRDTAPIKPVCVVSLCGPTDLENPFFYSAENRIGKSVGVEYFRSILSSGIGCTIDPHDFDSARNAMRKYSPIRYVDENTVPTVFGHGENDDIVPYQNALDLDARLTACRVEHTFISFPDSGHGCEDKTAMKKIMQMFFACIDIYLK